MISKLLAFAVCFIGTLFVASLATPFLFQKSGMTPEWFTIVVVTGCVATALSLTTAIPNR